MSVSANLIDYLPPVWIWRSVIVRDREYFVKMARTGDGNTVMCPALEGCHSQGATPEEALENIRSAIAEYLDVQRELPFVSNPDGT